MFVAGLTPTSSRARTTSIASGSRSPSRSRSRRPSANGNGATTLDPTSAAGAVGLSLTSPLASPTPAPLAALPHSPPAESPKSPTRSGWADGEQDREFEDLVDNLRGALAPKGGRGKSWSGEAERKDFRIILVDKVSGAEKKMWVDSEAHGLSQGVRLPMRKIVPPSTPAEIPPSSHHSPLSPLTPTSPLHPDGLIAPVWVRKHAELVPSVFVLFLRLSESPHHDNGLELSANEAQKKEAGDREKEREREMDEMLVKEIGDRRKRLGERGIKLTIVLMASPATLG